ncbi:MAG: metallophosphoesterase, partial [Bacteroidota bacterium]
MIKCLFSSDFHGKIERYNKFFSLIETEKPDLVFWGGDLLPNHFKHNPQIPDFINDFVAPKLLKLKQKLAVQYPQIFVILGNDDPKAI